MKNIFILLFLLSASSVAKAQVDSLEFPFDTYHKNIYIEGLGASLLVGASFDMRLNPGQMDGIGFRVGVGGMDVSGYDWETQTRLQFGMVTFPIEFNNLVGSGRNSFIAGVGLLPIYFTADFEGSTPEIGGYSYQGDGLALAGGFVNFGYRFQPLTNGIMFQIQWNPMVLRGSGFQYLWGSVGLGFGFK